MGEPLFDAVFARRAVVTSERWMRALDAYERDGGGPDRRGGAMPRCAGRDIFWGYQFVTGALMLTLARTGRIDKLSGGLNRSDDFAAVKARMADFMSGGFRAICLRKE